MLFYIYLESADRPFVRETARLHIKASDLEAQCPEPGPTSLGRMHQTMLELLDIVSVQLDDIPKVERTNR